MLLTDLDEARERLPELVEAAERGEEVLIVRDGRVVARLGPHRPSAPQDAPPPGAPRVGGQLKGQIWMADDFDELPEDIARALGAADGPR